MAIHSSRNEDARRKVSHTWHRQNATRKKQLMKAEVYFSYPIVEQALSLAAYN